MAANSNKSWHLILAAVVAGILVAVIFFYFSRTTDTNADISPGSVNTETAASETAMAAIRAYAFTETSPPVRLIIPSIGVDAAVRSVGVAANGSLATVNSYSDVGWYKNGPFPGAPGNAVIEGHLDTVHTPYAVFFNLVKLAPGDKVEILDAAGRTATFVVTGSEDYPYDASTTALFAPSDESYLNLVTCDGVWNADRHNYSERLVVFTKRIN